MCLNVGVVFYTNGRESVPKKQKKGGAGVCYH